MTLKLTDAVTELNDRLKFCQSSATPAFSTQELERAITRGVKHYGHYRCYETVVDLALVAEQQEYDWPSEVIDIREFSFTNSDSQSAYSGIPSVPEMYSQLSTHYLESPALVTRNQNYIARFYDRALGHVEVDRSRKKITIFPTPSEAQTVKLPVIKSHAMSGSGDNREFLTVLDGDVEYILDWIEAQCLRSIAKAYAANNLKIGDRDLKGAVTAENLIAQAQDLEEKFEARFYQATVGRS